MFSSRLCFQHVLLGVEEQEGKGCREWIARVLCVSSRAGNSVAKGSAQRTTSVLGLYHVTTMQKRHTQDARRFIQRTAPTTVRTPVVAAGPRHRLTHSRTPRLAVTLCG